MGTVGTAHEDHGVGEVVTPGIAIPLQERFIGDIADGSGRTVEVDVVIIGASVEPCERREELARRNIGPRIDCSCDPLLKGCILLEHAAERLHQLLHVGGSLHLIGMCRKMIHTRSALLFENRKPVLVNRERLQLEREGWKRRVAGARFECPEFKCLRIRLRQNPRTARLGTFQNFLCRRLGLLAEDRAATASILSDDGFLPPFQPVD